MLKHKISSIALSLSAALCLALSLGPAQAASSGARQTAKNAPRVQPGTKSVRPVKAVAPRKRERAKVAAAPARPSMGQLAGLHGADDPLDLKSGVALVVDQETSEVLFAKNSQAVLPIASLTKLMTALVVVEAGQSLDEVLEITSEDIDTEKGSGSRLRPGTRLTRGEMLHLALMSSENRAANA
jgi:D-alanyl-D-alanine endopeptidase (penicillin-binding protein 7)